MDQRRKEARMSLAETEAKIGKHVGNIVKLGKAETGDKAKAAFLKDVVATLKQAKTFEKTQTALNRRIKEAKALSDDIASYRKDWDAFVKNANQLAQHTDRLRYEGKGLLPDRERPAPRWIVRYAGGVSLTRLGQPAAPFPAGLANGRV
jgi:hypothetical protein